MPQTVMPGRPADSASFSLSTGPGTLNTVAGLYEAQFASSRVLLITGQVESQYYGKGKGFLHEFERQVDLLRTVTRRVESVRRTQDIGRQLAMVIDDISSGCPQPGAIEIPIDLQYAAAEIDLPEPPAPRHGTVDLAGIRRAADVIRHGERLLIWAGGGVVSANAHAELTALAERLDAPVITTYEGRGIDRRGSPACRWRENRSGRARSSHRGRRCRARHRHSLPELRHQNVAAADPGQADSHRHRSEGVEPQLPRRRRGDR